MRRVIYLIGFVILSIGCSTAPIQLQVPITIVATVSEPNPTDWWRDYCQDGVLVPHQPECAQTGGIISRVKLSNIRTLEGESIEGTIIIGFPGHKYVPNYQQEKEIQLQASPPRFREATGLEFFANDWKNT